MGINKTKKEELLSIIRELEKRNTFLIYDKPELYWRIRKALGLRICSLDCCNGEGIIGNGFGDEYYCKCMSEKEINKYEQEIKNNV